MKKCIPIFFIATFSPFASFSQQVRKNVNAVQEEMISTVTDSEPEKVYSLGFGAVSTEIMAEKQPRLINDKIDSLKSKYGVEFAFQSLNSENDSFQKSKRNHCVSKLLENNPLRKRNSVMVLFDALTGKSWIYFGSINGIYFNTESLKYSSAFTKIYKEKTPFDAMNEVLTRIQSVYSQMTPQQKERLAKIPEILFEEIIDNAFQRKDYEEACKYLKRIVKKNPNDRRSTYNLAWALAQSEKCEEAISIAKQGLKITPITSSEAGDFYRMIGNCYTELKELEKGREYLLKAIRSNENDALAYYNLGFNYYDGKKFEDAVFYLTSAIEKGHGEENDLADTYFYIGTSFRELGKFDKAQEYFEKALEMSDFENYYFNYITTLLDLKKNEKALSVANEALGKHPENAILYFKRHQVYREMENKIKSDEDIRTAYKYDPKDADILYDLGIMYAENNEVRKALNTYMEALKNGAEASGLYSNMASLYAKNVETLDSAAYYYQKAIQISPQHANLYYNYALLLKKQEKDDQAIENCLKAISLNPDNESFYTNLGVIYLEKEAYEKAKEYFLSGLKIKPNDFELNANMAFVSLHSKTDYQAAVNYSTTALKVISGGKNKAQLLDIRGHARLLLGDYNSALYDYLEIVNTFTEEEKKVNGDSFTNLAYCYLGMKNYPLAKKYFEMSIEYEKKADSMIGLMILYHNMNDKDNLKKVKKLAIRTEPALKKGMAGIAQLEEKGYFYTEEQKTLLKAIFENK